MHTKLEDVRATIVTLDEQITNMERDIQYWKGEYTKANAWINMHEATINQLKEQIHHLTRAIQIGEDIKAVG